MKRIYCVEGHHDWGRGSIEPTVLPLLQLLESTGYWSDCVRRNCATLAEFKYFVKREWTLCSEGSILYFRTHGDSERVWFSDSSSISLVELPEIIHCVNRYVHFGGCSIFDTKKSRVRQFLRSTGASAVSGYGAEINWADVAYGNAPSLALELILFSSIIESEMNLKDGRNAKKKLLDLREDLNSRFPECQFRMLTRWD